MLVRAVTGFVNLFHQELNESNLALVERASLPVRDHCVSTSERHQKVLGSRSRGVAASKAPVRLYSSVYACRHGYHSRVQGSHAGA